METIADLFRSKAAAFSRGDIDAAFRSIIVPTTIYVGERALFVETHDQMVALIKKARDVVVKHDYDHSDATVVSEVALENGAVMVDVDWCHLNTSGGVIAKHMPRYYCAVRDGVWRFSLAEFQTAEHDPINRALSLS